jgi:hypothetical protein
MHSSKEKRKNRIISTPLKAIREHCLECCGWSSTEVGLCTAPLCALYKYRHGRRPVEERQKLSPEAIEKRRKILERLREAKKRQKPCININENASN